MADSDYSLAGIELNDDRYTIEQSLVRNKYKAMDSRGEVVLRGKQKAFKMKEEFPFEDADGTDVFTVKAGGILDVAGDYTLTDAQTGEDIVVLDHNYSMFVDHWKLRDPRTEALIAEITNRNKWLEIARSFVDVANFIPVKYDVTDVDGNHVASIDGQFSLNDQYEVTIDDPDAVPGEAVVAAAMVVDAIEGN